MRNFIERELPRLLDLIYAAALDPARWGNLLEALPASFGGASGVMHYLDRTGGNGSLLLSYGSDPSLTQAYAEHYSHINPYPAVAFNGRVPVGKVVLASSALGPELVEQTEFYNDWMKPQGATSDHIGIILCNDRDAQAHIAICPHASIYQRHKTRYIRQLGMLLPHLMRATEINRRLGTAEHARATTDAAFESLGIAAMLVDANARVRRTTGKAEMVLRKAGRVLKIDRHGVLCAIEPNHDSRLAAAIAAACSVRRNSGPVRLRCDQPGTALLCWIIASPTPAEHGKDSRVAIAHPTALVVITPIEREGCLPPEVISAALGLPPAEARLASALAAGRTLAEYAAETGHSQNTVRNQLASVFDRTGTSRQAELVALIGRLVPNIVPL
jgi:DNA-binding CsgD family transcriptional regulator